MANQYNNKVVLGNETLIDITDTTATASDVAQGKYFYLASGQKVAGTNPGGGSVTQDANGYIVLPETGGGTPTPPPTPEPWVRPSDWPDLSKMDVSGGDILYMTSYADEGRGFCRFTVTCTGNYTVEVGAISGSTFTAESTQSYASGAYCGLYYGSQNGAYKVLRVTGTAINKLNLSGNTAITIDGFNGYSSNQGIIDIVGKLPSGTGLSCGSQYNLVNVEISGLSLSGCCSSMFSSCPSLTSLDVSGWNTASVTNMNNMFSSCPSLTSLDVSDWNTASVTNMSGMFQNCYSLTSLDVSGWNTASVTNMSGMFSACYSLTSLDVSDWNTASVTSMNSMFYYCYSLTSLDVSGFSTASVTSMNSMFYYCASLTSLDVSGFSTASVTSMSSMFYGCASLTSLDVSGFNTASVTNMSSMFQNCYSLTSLDVSGFNTVSVMSMGQMFYNCASLTSLDVSGFNTASVTNMSSMFQNCYSLTSLDVSGFNTVSVMSMGQMFYNCASLTSLDVSGFNTASVTDVSNIFCGCNSITSLDVSGWNFTKVTTANNAGSMFSTCYGLRTSLTLPASMTVIGAACFSSCRSITEWHFLATTPPTLSNINAFSNMNDYGGKKIYVPAASLTAYQTATNWSTYASYMVGE